MFIFYQELGKETNSGKDQSTYLYCHDMSFPLQTLVNICFSQTLYNDNSEMSDF